VYKVFWCGNQRKITNWENLDMDGGAVLKKIFMRDFGHGLDSSDSGHGPVATSGESSKESQAVHKVGSFIVYLRSC